MQFLNYCVFLKTALNNIKEVQRFEHRMRATITIDFYKQFAPSFIEIIGIRTPFSSLSHISPRNWNNKIITQFKKVFFNSFNMCAIYKIGTMTSKKPLI